MNTVCLTTCSTLLYGKFVLQKKKWTPLGFRFWRVLRLAHTVVCILIIKRYFVQRTWLADILPCLAENVAGRLAHCRVLRDM